MPPRLSRILAGGAIVALVVSCAAETPAAPAAAPAVPVAATAAPAVVATAAPAVVATPAATASLAPLSLLAHKVGAAHAQQPKRLEAVIEIDMADNYFGNTLGDKNPTFTLPVGKTVGIHFHNEGTVMHEFAIGRIAKKDGGYEKSLFETVKADIFFYYGTAKAEIGGATFEEMEVEAGLRDVWLRFVVPAELKGEWEIGCFAPEHYEKGMKAKIVFQ